MSRMKREQELELVRKAKAGCNRSATQLLKRYNPLVHKQAGKYKYLFEQHRYEDAVQEGMMGILHAIQTYNPDHGTLFFSWVFYQVRGNITKFGHKQRRHRSTFCRMDEYQEKITLVDPSQPYEPEDDWLTQTIAEAMGGRHTEDYHLVMARLEKGATYASLAKEAGVSASKMAKTVKALEERVREAVQLAN